MIHANHSIATFNEKLLLGQGLAISPLKDGSANPALAPKSLYEVVSQIDNEKDFNEYVLSHERNPAAVTSDQIQYKRHPVSPACTDANMFLAKSCIPDTWRIIFRARCACLATDHAE